MHLCVREIINISFRNENILTKHQQKHRHDRTHSTKTCARACTRAIKPCVCVLVRTGSIAGDLLSMCTMCTYASAVTM